MDHIPLTRKLPAFKGTFQSCSGIRFASQSEAVTRADTAVKGARLI